VTDATAPDVVSTGMGWWRPDAAAPAHGALDVNINATLSYDGPFDPASGSPDARGLLCRVTRAHQVNPSSRGARASLARTSTRLRSLRELRRGLSRAEARSAKAEG
jgi:hypothetical protein